MMTQAQRPFLSSRMPPKPFESISIDFMSLPKSKSDDTLMVVFDYLTKRSIFIPSVKRLPLSISLTTIMFSDTMGYPELSSLIGIQSSHLSFGNNYVNVPKLKPHYRHLIILKQMDKLNDLIVLCNKCTELLLSNNQKRGVHFIHLVEFNYNNSIQFITGYTRIY